MENILDLDPLQETHTHQERIEFLVKALVYGISEGKWTSSFIIAATLGKEDWILQAGSQEHQLNLSTYLQKWGDQLPQVDFLLHQEYVQIIKYTSRGFPVYQLTPKANELLKHPISMLTAFISYSRTVSSLQAILVSNWLWRNQIENFLDVENADGGGLLNPYLADAIRGRKYFICLLGEVEVEGKKINTLHSSYVRNEISIALEQQKLCIPFIQHNWSIDSLEPEQRALANQLLDFKGIDVGGSREDHDPKHAKAYDTALRDLLGFLK